MTAAPKLSLDAVLAAALVAVTVPALGAWLGAHTGTAGTVIGTAIGAVLSVLTGWLVLRVSYHTRSGLARVPWRKAKPWHLAVAALGVFVVAMVAVTGVEAGVLHKSLSASVTHAEGSGTTVGTVVANHPARPAASGSGTASASSVPATPMTVTPTMGGTPGTPQSPAAMTPDPSTSTNVPPASPVPAQTPRGEPS